MTLQQAYVIARELTELAHAEFCKALVSGDDSAWIAANSAARAAYAAADAMFAH